MPKRKTPKDDQPELPLNGNSATPEPSAPTAGGDAPAEAVPVVPATPGDAETPVVVDAESAALPPVKLENSPDAPLVQHYRNWFLDYASYVILDRAVPHIDDGLKPVQRRILHTLWEMDDGRFHKVANVVGATMRYHPHGDASIGAALVGMGQRRLLIDPQGNFGNPLTGDGAAAPRYIEARLTNFAREVAFNPKTTTWQLCYDGRNKEPLT